MDKSVKIFPTAKAANYAIDTFQTEFSELCAKHGIASAYVALGAYYLADDGEQTFCMTAGGCGEMMPHETIVAYALGSVQADRRQRINKMITRAAK